MSEAASAIRVRGLTKTYVVPVRDAGVRAALLALVRRKTREVEAVREIDFDIAPGEVVGFLGPNGAGKTTSLKMLSGLLHPTEGEGLVLGHVPARREKAFLRQITLVMGQRNQLLWDIPVIDSFERNRAIYRLEPAAFAETLREITDLLELGELLNKPVRNLSLGERMKCEVGVALLHRPRVLFLDEPVAPIALLPEGLQTTAQALPFYGFIAFPVELALGRLTPEQVVSGFANQIVWLAIALGVIATLWRVAVRRFSAVGG